jgi:hypothetical protein
MAMLLAALRAARGRVLGDLTMMLLRLSGSVVWRSEKYWDEANIDRGDQTDMLIGTLAELLEIVGAATARTAKLKQVEAVIEAHGGCTVLQKACAKQSRRQRQPFAHQAFSPYRIALLHIGRILPLKAARNCANPLLKAVRNVALEPTTSTSTTSAIWIADLSPRNGELWWGRVAPKSPNCSTGATWKWLRCWNWRRPSKPEACM